MMKVKNKNSLNVLPNRVFFMLSIITSLLYSKASLAQTDTTKKERQFKNVVRYNLSSALILGIDNCIVLGYERLLEPRQSFSVNIGKAALPKLTTIITD